VYILFNFQLLQELKRNIEQYKPLKELNVDQARVLLVGQVGAGKSSFFNTINSIFRGYITSQACSGNAEHSLTTVVSNIHHYLYRARLSNLTHHIHVCTKTGLQKKNTNPKFNKLEMWKIKSIIQIKIKYFRNLYIYIYICLLIHTIF
jgi:predicted GTPase